MTRDSLFSFLRRKRGEWLCWRGAHEYLRRPTRATKLNAWTTTYTNAVCRRCHHWGWENWRG